MIEKIGSYLPATTVSNEELVRLFTDWTAEKIFEKTGIRERRVAGVHEYASDLAFCAAERVLDGACKADIDFLLFCTQSPENLLPTSACVLQHRLGLPKTCGALDFNLGCSGYIYGLLLAESLIRAKQVRTVLLLTGDTYSKLLASDDRSTRTIFGDAATATVLRANSQNRLHSFVWGTDGSGAEQLMMPRSGVPHPHGAEKGRLYMNGPEVFNFTIQAVPQLVMDVLSKANLTIDSIDLVVFHQANAYMLEHLRRRLRIPPEKFVVHLEPYGNTVSSTIPIALEGLLAAGRLKAGMKVLLAGFGVGLSWGGCILEWNS